MSEAKGPARPTMSTFADVHHPRNPGMPLDLSWVLEVGMNARHSCPAGGVIWRLVAQTRDSRYRARHVRRRG